MNNIKKVLSRSLTKYFVVVNKYIMKRGKEQISPEKRQIRHQDKEIKKCR